MIWRKKHGVALAAVFIVALMVFPCRSRWRSPDPGVRAAVAGLKELPREAGSSRPKPAAHVPIVAANRSEHRTSVADPDVVTNVRALSSFLPTEQLADLSGEQLAALERVLLAARRSTYTLLVERGTTTRLPNAGLRVTVPGQGDDLGELRAFVYDSIEEIVGGDRMVSLKSSLGPKFDAKFAYFGKYDTVIDLSFDQPTLPTRPSDFVTMRSQYDRVSFVGFNAGRVVATSVLRLEQFENTFVPLASLQPKP